MAYRCKASGLSLQAADRCYWRLPDSVTKAGGKVILLAEQAPMKRLAKFASGLWHWPAKVRQSITFN
ncbi:Uncharacterised protein [Serratia fonticola]|uniref:Uncharacterized protein n=1 Tax=Serratia fonticola TaxID=47917 RepID=A0A4V6KLN9_SERFO|nr:Uncharacterised protein [Serratia fonticola]